jgi:hypothetical protein
VREEEFLFQIFWFLVEEFIVKFPLEFKQIPHLHPLKLPSQPSSTLFPLSPSTQNSSKIPRNSATLPLKFLSNEK